MLYFSIGVVRFVLETFEAIGVRGALPLLYLRYSILGLVHDFSVLTLRTFLPYSVNRVSCSIAYILFSDLIWLVWFVHSFIRFAQTSIYIQHIRSWQKLRAVLFFFPFAVIALKPPFRHIHLLVDFHTATANDSHLPSVWRIWCVREYV